MNTKIRTYKGMLNAKLGIWWMRRRGYRVVGNVSIAKRLMRQPLYTVTFER